MVLLVLLKRYLGKPCDHFHCVIFDRNRWEQAKSWQKKKLKKILLLFHHGNFLENIK